MKPFSASEVLRNNSPRELIPGTFQNVNRYHHLRDESPAPDGARGRSPSIKRKSPSEPNEYSYAQAASASDNSELPSNHDSSSEASSGSANVEQIQVNIAKVNSLCENVCTNICETNCDPTIISAISQLSEAIKLVNSNHAAILTHTTHKPQIAQTCAYSGSGTTSRPQSSFVSLGAIAKKLRPDNSSLSQNLLPPKDPAPAFRPANAPVVHIAQQKSDADKLRDALREAEKSTVLFNLNMGSFPLMNTTSIAKKASLALTSMAAKVEKKANSVPSPEAVTAIDDLLSVTKNMSFFGNSTKPYNNPLDPDHGKFYTVPVRYDFKDRDTRSKAEKILRARCNVSCSSPYPAFLKECIRQTNSHFKKEYPDSHVMVSVDIQALSLRVLKKGGGEGEGWVSIDRVIPIPTEAYNLSPRAVPKGYKMPGLRHLSVSTDVNMSPSKGAGRQSTPPASPSK
jgi:hypothetical protein